MLDILSGRERGVAAGGLRALLAVASGPYAVGMRVRRWAYRRGVLPVRRAGAAVICVGNLTTGGTGKTPMVAWVVARLRSAGRKPAILTRGYRAVAGRSDEAELLKDLCGVPVIVNADRVAGAEAAVAGGADVLVMDDGFQHRRLGRDLDIVLIDAAEPFGFGWTLPRGLLREGPRALRDAGAVVVTHADAIGEAPLSNLRGRLARLAPAASIHVAAHRPVALLDESGQSASLDALSGRKVFAFCGIARPERFFDSLTALGARPADTRALDDHAAYTPDVAKTLRRAAEDSGAGVWITTQKDFVKLADTELSGHVWQLAVGMAVVEGEEALTAKILAAALVDCGGCDAALDRRPGS